MRKDEKNIEDENLRKEAPRLFGLKKEEPFTAPDGYFERFMPTSKLSLVLYLTDRFGFFLL